MEKREGEKEQEGRGRWIDERTDRRASTQLIAGQENCFSGEELETTD